MRELGEGLRLNGEIEEEDMIKYSLLYEENVFLTGAIKSIKDHIDKMFTKYDPRTVPVKAHPISDSLKY